MKKKIIFITISIFLVILILFSSTYALLFKTDETDKQSYTTGILSITSEAIGNSVTLNNSLPMSDSDGENSTPYIFRITNTGNLSYKFNVMLLSTTTDNQIGSEYIKLKVNDNTIVKLNSLTNGVILSDITLKPTEYIDVTLRVWLDINTPNTEIGKTYNAKITTEGQAVYTNKDYAKETLTRLGLTENDTVLTTFTNTSKNDGTTGIYKAEDDLGESYYFRGNVTNNYVKFAGFYWRIIRINGDGSIRMIYDGTSAHANNEASTDRQIGTSAYNTNYNDNAYVGYKFGTAGSSTYEATHANTNDSTIKTYLDNWYNSNIKGTTDEQYVADAIYCNDRTRVTDSTQMSALNSIFGLTATGEGYGTKGTYYGFLNRTLGNFTTAMPSLKCEQLDDKFTKSSSLGNGKLDNPIGLITLDEMVYAGSYLYMDDTYINDETYLYNGSNWYWSMSPFDFNYGHARVGHGSQGAFSGGYFVNDDGAVRPVISLSSEAISDGTGTKDDPFKINHAKNTLTQLELTESTGTPNFSKTSCSSGCEESTVGIYKTEDDLGTSYYFRGDVSNNYVYFANKYWRIIRINGDGTIRMIYDGTSAHDNGESSTDRQISTSAFNSSTNDNANIGYMYGTVGSSTYETTHSNTNDSTIKKVLDTWYTSNIKGTTNEQYVVDAIYCNDRELQSGTGTGDDETYYKAYNRNYTNKTPTLKCKQVNDRFTRETTVSGVIGNGALTYPIGLITVDEAAYAGGLYYQSDGSANNSKYYLYTGNYYWTMSPFGFFVGGAIVGRVDEGAINGYYVGDNIAVRAVLSLSSGALSSGTGTKTDPFKIG